MSDALAPEHLINLIALLASAGALAFLSYSERLEDYCLPLPLLGLAWGVAVGPFALGWVTPEAFGEHQQLLLREVTRAVFAIALMAIALRLPHGFWRRSGRFVTLVLAFGMVAMWLTATAVISLTGAYTLLTCLTLAAIITPTDPVVSSPIVTGPIANANVPQWIRSGISAESGSNDGLGLLFVLLPITLIKHGAGWSGWSHWLTHALLKEIGVAVLVGLLLGWIASKMFATMKRLGERKSSVELPFALVFPVFVLTLTRLLHADGILAVFIAGVVFSRKEPESDEAEEEEGQEAVNKVAMVLFFMLVGVHLPLEAWAREISLLAACGLFVALILRRLLPILLLGRVLQPGIQKPETAFISVFAPVGAAAVYYTMLAQDELHRHDLWAPVSLVITLSVVFHGISATPASKWLGRKISDGRQRSGHRSS